MPDGLLIFGVKKIYRPLKYIFNFARAHRQKQICALLEKQELVRGMGKTLHG